MTSPCVCAHVVNDECVQNHHCLPPPPWLAPTQRNHLLQQLITQNKTKNPLQQANPPRRLFYIHCPHRLSHPRPFFFSRTLTPTQSISQSHSFVNPRVQPQTYTPLHVGTRYNSFHGAHAKRGLSSAATWTVEKTAMSIRQAPKTVPGHVLLVCTLLCVYSVSGTCGWCTMTTRGGNRWWYSVPACTSHSLPGYSFAAHRSVFNTQQCHEEQLDGPIRV